VSDQGTATATILFSDMEDSTAHRSRLGELAADRLFRAHERLLADTVTAHRGRVVKTAGDGVMAAFDASSDAVAAAVALQQRVTAATPELQIRIGVAAGDVSWEDGDCFGLPVVTAARLESIAEPGQILATSVVRLMAGDRAGDRYVPLGAMELKGLAVPVEVHQVSWDPPGTQAATVEWRLPAALASRSAIDFVGRAEEMARLDAAWDTVRGGGRSVVLIGGEAGAGKTRLASEFARRCHHQGAAVMFGGCDSELALPYQPWVSALEHTLRDSPQDLLDDLADRLPHLMVLLPQLDRMVVGLGRPAATDPDTERYQLFEAVEATLRRVAREVPIVLLLDDLHWAGHQTVSLVRHLARTGPVDGMLILGTFRDTGDEITEPLATTLADLRRVDGVSRIRLEGLDEADVHELLTEAGAGSHHADLAALAATITARTGGNPFYVAELLRHLDSTTADGAGMAGEAPGIADVVPDSVREVVAARLARLSPAGRSLAELAAVAGGWVPLPVLLASATLEEREVASALSELVGAGLLIESHDAVPEYRSAHALLRDTVAEGMPTLGRSRAHLAIAAAIERVHEADRRPALADLVRHYAAAAALGGRDKAMYYGRRAAAQARRTAAYDEAASLLGTALSVAPAGSTERAQLLVDLADILARSGHHLDSLAVSLEAHQIACDAANVELRAQAALAYELAAHLGNVPATKADSLVAAALDLVDDRDPALRTKLWAALGRAQALAGHDAAAGTIEHALAAARRLGDPETVGLALEAATIIEADLENVLTICAELEELTLTTGNAWRAMWATGNSMRASIALGRLGDARGVLLRHRQRASTYRFLLFDFMATVCEGMLALADGRFDEAEAAAEAAEAMGTEGDNISGSGVYGLQMFVIRREQGRLDEMRPVLRAMSQLADRAGVWGPGLAVTYAELGMVDQARVVFDRLAGDGFESVPRDAMWPASLAFLADTCLALGDAQRALPLYECLAAHGGLNLVVGFTTCLGPADRLRGGLAALLGRDGEADAHFEAALALAGRSGSPVWTAHVQHDWARVLARRGDHEAAVPLAAHARRVAAEIGIGSIRDAPPPERASAADDRPRPDGLSDRELEVLSLVARGCSNREIGKRLYISPNTAANHVRSILQKTGCANRTEAATHAVRLGVVATTDDGS